MAGRTRSSSSASLTAGPGPAFTPPTSRMSAPAATSSAARAHQGVEGEGRALVVEGVGRPVQDAHDQGPRGQIEGPITETEAHRENLHAPYPGVVRRRRPGRAQKSRAASALRYARRARIVGTQGLEEVEELLARAFVVLHLGEQAVEQDVHPVGGHLDLLGGQACLGRQPGAARASREPGRAAGGPRRDRPRPPTGAPAPPRHRGDRARARGRGAATPRRPPPPGGRPRTARGPGAPRTR